MLLKDKVIDYCVKIGKDPLLVQCAGGNVSWKQEDTLWIKASGTWLAHANTENIFIPLSLKNVRKLINKNIADFTTACLLHNGLRPSIETSLHALMPHAIVVHVHAVDVIAKAVLINGQQILEEVLQGLNWLWIHYAKPGLALTKEILELIDIHHPPDILVLANHGLVVAGNSLEKINDLLQDVVKRCQIPARIYTSPSQQILDHLTKEWQATGYCLPTNPYLHALGFDPVAVEFVKNKWVLYPDHVVFLGKEALFLNEQPPQDFVRHFKRAPPCFFVEGKGIVVSENFSEIQKGMLNCYLDIISRLTHTDTVNTLNAIQVNELLTWDAEKYRQLLNVEKN